MYCVTWSPMSAIWWRSSKVSDSFNRYFWLVSPLLGWKMAVWFSVTRCWLNIIVWCAFAVKPIWNRTLWLDLQEVYLKNGVKYFVCLKNFNHGISAVLNLAPCNFTGCWRGGTPPSHISKRGFNLSGICGTVASHLANSQWNCMAPNSKQQKSHN